jgi:hypothetical protein
LACPCLKEELGVVVYFREEIAKAICAGVWPRKDKGRPVSGFSTKIAYVKVMNFILLKFPHCIIRFIHRMNKLPLVHGVDFSIDNCTYANWKYNYCETDAS